MNEEFCRFEIENWELRTQNPVMQRTNDLLDRTREFALATIKFCETLPKDETSKILGRQLLRSGTSVGANYRAAYRAKSKPDFISKMGTVLEEPTNAFIGLISYRPQEKSSPPDTNLCCKRLTSWLQSLLLRSKPHAATRSMDRGTRSRKCGPEGSAF